MSSKLVTIPASDAAVHAARFQAMHRAAGVRGMEFKLLAYFAGYEVRCLRDLHQAEHGETRGRKKAVEGNKCQEATIPLTEFLRQQTACSLRSAYRYQDHYDSVFTSHPEAAAKLNAYYEKAVAAAALEHGKGEDAAGAALALASPEACKLPAKALQGILEQADAWGLEQLFTAEEDAEEGSEEDDEEDGKGRKLSPLVKFYAKQLFPRLKGDDFLRLPKPQLRALATVFEEVVKKAKEALEGKTPAPAKKAKA
jgi:hypothetical protein